jgi:hypothetical protein
MSGRERDGWERHREEQARAWLRLSHAERLAWLEEAKRFAQRWLGVAHRGPREIEGARARPTSTESQK